MRKREGFVDLLELDWRFELDSSENLDSESSFDVCGEFYTETENKSVLHLLLLRWSRFPLIFLLLFLEFPVITLIRPFGRFGVGIAELSSFDDEDSLRISENFFETKHFNSDCSCCQILDFSFLDFSFLQILRPWGPICNKEDWTDMQFLRLKKKLKQKKD